MSPHVWTSQFLLMLLFLVFQLGSLQHTFTFLQPLRILLVTTLVLGAMLLMAFLTNMFDVSEPRAKLLVLFWILMALHIPFAYNNSAALGLTRTVFPYVVLFLAMVNFTRSSKQLSVLIHLWMILHVYQAVHGITHVGRGLGGYVGDENDLGVTLCMAIPVAYFLLLGSSRAKRWLYAGCLLILVLGVLSTMSRGGFVGLVAVGIYCLWLSPKRFAGAATIMLIVFIALAFAPAGYWEEMETLKEGTQEATADNRMFLWQVAWKIFLDNPIWGVGPGSVNFAFSIYQPRGGYDGVSMGGRGVHSTYFQVLSELGLCGAMIFGGVVYRHFRSVVEIWRCPSDATAIPATSTLLQSQQAVSRTHADFLRWAAVGFGGGLVGFLSAGAFVSVLYYPQLWIMSGIMVALHPIWNDVKPEVDGRSDNYQRTGG